MLLGDPSFIPNVTGDLDFNGTAYKGIRPSFSAGSHYSLPSDVLSRTRDICAASDPICAYHASELAGLADGRSAHYHYTSMTYEGVTLTHYAGNWLWAHHAPASPPSAPTKYETGRQVRVVSQATGGVSGHKGPANSYAAGPTHPANSALWIVCHVNGQSIAGPYGTETIWDLGDDGYYYSDAWIWTGSNSAVVPACSLKNVTVVSQATGGDSGHVGPSNAYAAGSTHPAGATIQIACYVGGQSIAGPYGTETIWDLSTDGTTTTTTTPTPGSGPTPTARWSRTASAGSGAPRPGRGAPGRRASSVQQLIAMILVALLPYTSQCR